MAYPQLIVCSLFFIAIYHTTECIAIDTVSAKQPLLQANNLTSNSDIFVLGFFKPDANNQNYYLGIWYSLNKVSVFTPVWEANPESPVTDPEKWQLRISETDGNLVLVNQLNTIVWSTAVKIPSHVSTVAVLLDAGNLQLRDESNSSTVLWQSFDHPTNTWLPGARIGYNKLTKEAQRITAWKNSVNPEPGIYSLEADQKGTSQYYALWNRSRIYWQSALWNPVVHKFGNIPEMVNNYLYYFDYVNTTDVSYFSYSVIHSSLISRFMLDVSGQMQQLSWVDESQQWTLLWTGPRQVCQIYALCGVNSVCNGNIATICSCPEGFSEKNPRDWALQDYSSGCLRNTPLQCQSSSFRSMSDMRLPDNPKMFAVDNIKVCKKACINNCSCTAYSYNSSGCFLWHGDLINLQEQYDGLDAGTLYLRVAPSMASRNKDEKIFISSVVAGVLVAFAAIILLILCIVWRRRRGLVTSERSTPTGTLLPFRYSELQKATKNFSERLGGGGFGTVFKGALPDSSLIAVKRLEGVQQGEKQFRTEVSTIGTLQHVNLVRLLGFCSEESKRLLVYEYMPLGSLNTLLFRKPATVIDWKTRYGIALGIAKGLLYLHDECRHCIIHCDVKPENILLDERFVAKVADFGLAKLVGRDFSRVLTTFRGTRGYLAPEWISGMAITAKADVYSYGMMLFEIISGRRNFAQMDGCNSSFYFPTFAATKLISGDVNCLLDQRLAGELDLDSVARACKVACWCIHDDEKVRPTMSQIVRVLEGFQEINMPPVPKLLEDLGESAENINYFSYESSAESSRTYTASFLTSDILR